MITVNALKTHPTLQQTPSSVNWTHLKLYSSRQYIKVSDFKGITVEVQYMDTSFLLRSILSLLKKPTH